jgi:superfamily I DNA/RNA helicase
MTPLERALKQRGIAFQSKRDEAFRRFDWAAPTVKLLTMHSAKGLEFAHVFVAGLQALPQPQADAAEELRLLYVAMTRATQTLVLSAAGESPVVERVRDALRAVQAGFSS